MPAVVQQYDNWNCAWNILRLCAWSILEQYDNWQAVLQGAVAIHAPLGEFHAANELIELGSTKIVLGEIQPKSALGDLGQYDN